MNATPEQMRVRIAEWMGWTGPFGMFGRYGKVAIISLGESLHGTPPTPAPAKKQPFDLKQL